MSRRLLAAAVTTALTVTMSAGLTAGAVAAPSDPPGVPPVADVALPAADAAAGDKISPALAKADGAVTVFVELDAASGVQTAEAGGDKAAVEAAAADVEQMAAGVVPDTATGRAATADAPQTIAVTTDLVPGMVVHGNAADLRALATKPGVTSIRIMTPKVPMNAGTDVFTRSLAAWHDAGYTGKGVRIGIIDTGLDYTHADFGGPGTAAAYAQAYGTDGTGPIPADTYDPAKFLGGWDFAGPTYDAGGSGADLEPQPDANPIDSPEGYTEGSSHGSHVAGTAAGYGVLADGSTFRGDYSTLTDLTGWQIGPGSAPQAGIYVLKVFGDKVGSTNLTLPALEWAADPNNDGDYSDHLDVVNMSLGSDYGPADDPENDFVDALAKIGVVTVVASGNAGDATDIGGTPGNATASLTVANSVGDSQMYDAVDVTSSDGVATGIYAAQNTIAYAGPDVTAPVVYLDSTFDGCTALTPDQAAAVAGKIAWLWWDDNDATRACGSGARWDNLAAAGAVGAIAGWSRPTFTYGLTGSEFIPGAMLTAASTTALMPEIEAGTLTMRIGPGLASSASETNPAAGDLLNDSSSRGVHGSLGIVKPDVAAPGTSISSVASGTGTGRTTKSGTSMATPHVTGIAALVRQAHPRWTAQQVKAAVMNTATHDVWTEPGQTGDVYGPERVGSGRVDALAAVSDDVIAYAADNPSLVSVTFGVVPVGDTTVVRKAKVTVRNLGRTTKTYSTSFAKATSAGLATISVSPSSIKVPGHSTRTVWVTLTADPSTLAKQIDPTSSLDSPVGPGTREFVTSISGRLVLTETSGSQLRVPVQAAPRLVSDMSAKPLLFSGDTATLGLQGSDALSGGWLSIVAPMVLAATSPVLPETASAGVAPSVVASGDLRYVGYSSTAPQIAAAGGDPATGSIGIGIAVQGEWTSLGSTVYPIIDIDVDGDGTPDFETIVWKYSAGTDLTSVETYRLSDNTMVDFNVVNGLTADVQTTVFDNNVLVAPISMSRLGLTPGTTPTFYVQTWSPVTGDVVDDVAPFTIDPYAPPYWFDDGRADSQWYLDTPGDAFVVHRSTDAGDAKVLLLHALNDAQSRAEVVAPVTPAPAEMYVWSPWWVTDASRATIAVALRSTSEPSGTVEVRDGDTVLATATVRTTGTVGYSVLHLPRLSAGTHHLTVAYSGNDYVQATSVDRVLTVVHRWHH